MAKLLLVDDDPEILESMKAWLELKHEVQLAASFGEALDVLIRGPLPDVIITDYDMPPDRGDQLLALVAARFPRVGRILHTGTPRALAEGTLGPAQFVLPKGGDVAELEAAIARCLASEEP
jgi:two-component system response regulator YesN